MEVLRKEEICTAGDICKLPDGERAELIDGQIYYMAPSSARHQMLVPDWYYQKKIILGGITVSVRQSGGVCCVFE